ncbi:phosphatidylserine decarboxylase [Candidatus Sulfurimonas marisnigri]|uniref:Phosphatidylserine decarboxylase n=1 Tax=Candidatus Sulfurimonas marisnigri TaxID=2740405 RepID=A0A7S7M140_9BACT|nr:phosphatidylserine decarboxylase [Candidatus Sulfurimonas marisnigri]QOY55141.1 phosphatidylserine decarboxylase [Candidatus Sulfurimonas marisnigri]
MRNNLLPIAKEGLNYIIWAILSFAFFAILDLDFLQFFTFLVTLFFLFVFRNPERENIIFQENSVVSPVDGVVVSIEELKDNKYTYKVEIDSNYFNVSLLRSPLTSLLSYIEIYRGTRLSPLSTLSKNINEKVVLIFRDKNENSIKVVHRLKQSFMNIKIDAIKNQNLLKGSRYGVMINGITTLYLPQNFRLNVSVGNELTASQALIGYFTNDKKNK